MSMANDPQAATESLSFNRLALDKLRADLALERQKIAMADKQIDALFVKWEAAEQCAITAEQALAERRAQLETTLKQLEETTVNWLKEKVHAEKAKRAASEMRDVLLECDTHLAGAAQPTNRAKIHHAISSDAGAGYLSPAEVRAKIKPLREALKPFAAMNRDTASLTELACERGTASDRTIITSQDFYNAAQALNDSEKGWCE